jgi:acyl-coenzyme A thioesterase PaaI-like protein
MQPTDLALNQAMGMRVAPAGSPHLLELPLTPLLKNHLGTMHAAAQFTLAEAASAECLLREFPTIAPTVVPVVRGVTLKYRKPATGDLFAYASADEATRQNLATDLANRSAARATVNVELKDAAGTVTFSGQFEWFIAKLPSP